MLFSFLILFYSPFFASIDSNGWASVDRPSSYYEEEVDAFTDGQWVVFVKEMELEKLSISLPKDPQYFYSSEGMEISSVKDRERFQLSIQKKTDSFSFDQRVAAIQATLGAIIVKAEKFSLNEFDLLYYMEGKWVQERLVITPHYVYDLKTSSDQFSEENHLFFIDSFSVKN